MKTSAAKIYLKTPERKWLWFGGLAACALPFFGCLGLFLLGSLGASGPDTGGVFYITMTDMFIVLLTPIVGTFIAAYLGTREILKKNRHGFKGKGDFVWIAIKAGFLSHWIVVSLFIIFIVLIGGPYIFGTGVYILVKSVAMFVFYAFLLWGILTLPISLVGGFIFWFVAVRGSENLMAEIFD